MKRYILLLAVLCSVLLMFTGTPEVRAAEPVASGSCGENVQWLLDSEGVLYITGSGDMTDYGYVNMEYDTPWYSLREQILTVRVESGVTSIGSNAFAGCSNLRSANLADTVTEIGVAAFSRCESMWGVNLPSGLIRIKAQAFYGCSGLVKVDLPVTLTEIGEVAFAETAVISVQFPVSLKVIGEMAFSNCADLQYLQFADSVETVGAYAFQNCPMLEAVRLPEKVTVVNKGAFQNCGKLEYVYLSAQTTTICDSAFAYCGMLKMPEGLPESVTNIGSYAFVGCGSLYELNFPDALTTIGEYAFSETGLLEAKLPKNLKSLGHRVFAESELSTVTLPEGLENIADGAFYKCTQLQKVDIPDGVKTLGEGVFAGCTALKTVDLSNQLTQISNNLFEGCRALKEITIPDAVEALGEYAFFNCNNLKDITLPESLESVGEYAFCGCQVMEQITIPDGVKELGKGVFRDCEALKELVLPSSLAVIREELLLNCKNLLKVTVPAGVARVEPWAFYNCYNLGEVCFQGTEEQWSKILVEDGNDELTSAKRTYPNVTMGAYRVFGNDRYQTAFKAADVLKQQLGVEQFNTVVVASGTDFADALSGSYLAAIRNAPMLLVRNNKNTMSQVKEYILKNLCPGGTVYILGGENAVPKSMETGLEGFTVKRLGGNTRYDTNLLILAEAGVGERDILVCTGKAFADSLSASAAKRPILLVKDSLNAAQKEFLSGTAGKKYIIGGTSAVSQRVESGLKTYGEVIRLGGADRYETSVLVAQTFFAEPKAIIVAYGLNFPDGLSGGGLAAGMDVPLILVSNGKEAAAAAYANERLIRYGYILGGNTLVSNRVVETIFKQKPIILE